jgi:hypothetical protein
MKWMNGGAKRQCDRTLLYSKGTLGLLAAIAKESGFCPGPPGAFKRP